MTRTLQQMILNLLDVNRGDLPARRPWKSFSDREWKQALAWLDLSGLAIYFLRRMTRTNSLSFLPDLVRAELERRGANNRLRSTEILQEFRTIIDAFEESHVKYAVLKGIALLPDYCAGLEFRTQYDHDVLIAPESFEAARNALECSGFRCRNEGNEESVVVYRKTDPEVRFSQNSEALYSSRLGRSVELHRTLWEESEERICVRLSDDFLERRQIRDWEGISFSALCDEDCLLFQILHAFKHILRNWCRLSIFLEVAYFINGRSNDLAFWRSFAARIENVRWAREATMIVFTLAEQLFGAAIPARLQSSLKSPLSPVLNLWIERYGRYSAVSNFHGDKCSLFLHREFVESSSEWTMIRRRRLFPFHRPHRPPAVVFQRGFSAIGRIWMEKAHALRRLMFHSLAGLRYVLEYPRWIVLRRLAESGDSERLFGMR
jgi:Uncharacterised nucleotidyltransferase